MKSSKQKEDFIMKLSEKIIQLRKVNQVLSENRNKRGLKIVFIHGNGKGVLKNEILKLLKKNFSTHKVSDASMQKYGTGALEVQV